MRDKLIELLNQINFDYCEECVCASEDGYKGAPDLAEFFADRLLAEGVIVPPYEINTKVYAIDSQTSDNRNLYIFEDTITRYIICGDYTIMCFYDHIGIPQWNWKRVFLTREEAERALERNENGT